MDLLPFAELTDEQLLAHVYGQETMTDLERELCHRLENALVTNSLTDGDDS